MYAREIDGREFTFGVSGKLIRNVLVMYDRQTDSLWSQLLGEAVEGEMVGTKLEFVSSWMTTWSDWKAQHPETLALEKGYYGSRDPYTSGYYDSPAAGVIGETFEDGRLYTKEFVVGVELGETAVAYPFNQLNSQPVLNDVVADVPLVVVFAEGDASALVYGRTLADGQLLTFQTGPTPRTLTDAETGSVWDALSGRATAGPLLGQTLTPLKSTTVFWFGWKDFHPDTILYQFRSCLRS